MLRSISLKSVHGKPVIAYEHVIIVLRVERLAALNRLVTASKANDNDSCQLQICSITKTTNML